MTPQDFEYVRKLVYDRGGLFLEPGKDYLIANRLSSLARTLDCPSVDELIGRLRSQPTNGVHRQVLEALVTTETLFFRDLHPFHALRDKLLPELLRSRQRPVMIWSAACASGQEPYSLAMLIREHFAHLPPGRIQILATDLSTEMVARARSGRYSPLEINRGLPAPMLVKYFRRDGADWVVRDELRAMIEFREFNLIEPWPAMPVFDVIFLRNVLIYFDVKTKQQVLGRAAASLARDGYLALGAAETTIFLADHLQRTTIGSAHFYQPPQA
jgi:chemotaxis protein methyltransferase CheR